MKNLGKTAYNYLHGEDPYSRDTTFGIYLGKDGHYHMGKQIGADRKVKENEKILTIAYNNIIVESEKFRGTDGLWELIMEDRPTEYTEDDVDEYRKLLIKTNVLHRDFDPTKPHPRASNSYKWMNMLGPIWEEIKLKKKEGYEGGSRCYSE